ncbi:hypothetical protein [Paenibacillus tarimensis]
MQRAGMVQAGAAAMRKRARESAFRTPVMASRSVRYRSVIRL